MIPGSALVIVVQLALADGLDAAKAAFDAGDYGRAEALALAEAGSSRAGEALYLAGLARFRAGRAAEALEALDAAARAVDPPERAMWQFNRGACLYELGRHAEAESAWLDAAAPGGPLAAVALANAGFAALDAGSPERARDLARRARGASSGAAAGLVDDLEAEIARGATPEDAAQDGAAAADAIATEGDDAADVPSRGLAARGPGWRGSLHLESGFDDNVLQSGLDASRERIPGTSSRIRSAVGATAAALAYVWLPRRRLAAEFDYAFDDVVFLAPSARDYGILQHGAASQLELSLHDRLRLGAAVLGHVAFTGLSDFRRMQAGAGARSWVALDEGAWGTTRITVEWTRKDALRSEFEYLAGYRADAAVEQQVQLGWLSLAASYRGSTERIGTLIEDRFVPAIPPPCIAGPGGCRSRYVIPLAYASDTVVVSAQATPGRRLAFGAAVGVEWRAYLAESHLDVFQPDGRVIVADPRQRKDERFFTTLIASWRLSPTVVLRGRCDLVRSRSNVERSVQPGDPCAPPQFRCHAFDYDDKNYAKTQLTAEAVLGW